MSKTKLIFIGGLIILTSCYESSHKSTEIKKTTNSELKSQSYNVKGVEFISFYNVINGLKQGRYFIFYKNESLLFQTGFVENDTLIGYHYFYDTLGQLFKKTRYEKDGIENSDAMVESINYDSTGNINYDKSYFTEIFPQGDTINIFSKKQLMLNFKLNYSTFEEARIYIYKIVNKKSILQDSVFTTTNKAKYLVTSLNKGINDFKFFIKLRHYQNKEDYADYESKTYRTIRVL